MKCLYPSEVSPSGMKSDGDKIQVPCGNCKYCRIHKKQAWIGRLRLEAGAHSLKCFTTLTYSDDNVKDLDYSDVQTFLKRYRKRRPSQSIRFFCVGEYGSQTARPHWHLLLFGTVVPKECPEWSHGYTYTGECNVKSIGYVAGYSLKDSCRPETIVRASNRPGIGMDQLFEYGKTLGRVASTVHLVPNTVTIGGRSYPMHKTAYERFIEGYKAGEGTITGARSLRKAALDHHIRKGLVRGNEELARDYLGNGTANIQEQMHNGVNVGQTIKKI